MTSIQFSHRRTTATSRCNGSLVPSLRCMQLPLLEPRDVDHRICLLRRCSGHIFDFLARHCRSCCSCTRGPQVKKSTCMKKVPIKVTPFTSKCFHQPSRTSKPRKLRKLGNPRKLRKLGKPRKLCKHSKPRKLRKHSKPSNISTAWQCLPWMKSLNAFPHRLQPSTFLKVEASLPLLRPFLHQWMSQFPWQRTTSILLSSSNNNNKLHLQQASASKQLHPPLTCSSAFPMY